MARNYTVSYDRGEDGWWVASVKGIKGVHTRGRSISEARKRVREALAAAVGVAAVRSARFRDSIAISPSVRKNVLAVKKAQRRAEREQAHAAELARKVARELVRVRRLSVRDAGEVMGISGGRVQQLVQD